MSTDTGPETGTDGETRPAVRTEKLPRIRKVIAQRMLQSLQTSAQLTSVVEVDLSLVMALRRAERDRVLAEHGTKLSVLPFLAQAAVRGLAEHPVVNASVDLDAGEVTYHDDVHLSVAVDTERGLMVPVVRDAARLSVVETAQAVADLADRARTGRLMPDDQAGGTFTVTNTGSRGALFDTPILNQPQVAILGTGAVVERPVAVRGQDGATTVEVHPMAYLALTYDHRLVDGADAARYLSTVKASLERPGWAASVLEPAPR